MSDRFTGIKKVAVDVTDMSSTCLDESEHTPLTIYNLIKEQVADMIDKI